YSAFIPEITPIGTPVKCDLKMGVYSKNHVDFIIISGNEQGMFSVDSRQVSDFNFMDIKTSKRLNRESVASYELNVVVQDKRTKRTLDRTKVNITVDDSNDNRPIFLKKKYLKTIPEDIPMHTSIARIEAVDADVGPNGLIYYSFKEKTTSFAINPISGVVSVAQKLSNSARIHRLTVVARDRALPPSKPKSSRNCQLIVNVQAVNQFSPEFSVKTQLQNVSEGTSGIVYATLGIIDKDKGSNGDIDRVEITSGNLDGAFSIKSSPNDYAVQVIKPLDRELAPFGYNVTLTAYDKGTPVRNGSYVLRVNVLDENDNNPEFNQSRYITNLSELAPIHTPVLRVLATDKDAGSNGNIMYVITRGNELGKFEINSKTGQIYTKGDLDYESRQRFDLTVAALDGVPLQSRKISTVPVVVNILDANDHDPEFKAPEYRKDLYEDLTPGTSVFTVSAEDLDSGGNGKVRYSLANLRPVPFEIEPDTGIIRTTTNLDRDTGLPEFINLQVRASDFGTPLRRETETLVKMRVKEMNDNAPVLKQFKCNILVDRNAPVGVLITTVTAIDIDISDKDQSLMYKSTFGNTGKAFSLDPKTGELRTARSLRGLQREFTLIIKATDGIQESPDTHPVILKISIVGGRQARKLQNHVSTKCVDSPLYAKALKIKQEQKSYSSLQPLIFATAKLHNRHHPVFRSHDQNIHISESTPIATVVSQFMATDEDKGYNGLVLYSIVEGDVDSVFNINMFTGELTVAMPLDRETISSYTLNISAVDCGKHRKSAYTILNVKITDVNDCSPVFDKTVYEVTLPENITVGQTVTHVHASDKDQGTNGFITYQIVNDFGGKFRVNRISGVVSVGDYLDYEEQEMYKIEIQAMDSSVDNQKVGSTHVIVTLLDINDNSPIVKPKKFNVTVQEDLLVNAVVTSIHASDPDSGPGGEIEFSLPESTRKFNIDSKSGVIRLRQRLDFEQKSTYNLTVRVTDKGSPALFTDVEVVVNVLDVNENSLAPVFSGGRILETSINENSPVGTVVISPKATDQDSWYLKYAIIDGTGVDKFIIDPDTGAIRTAGELDHEVADHYWLTVQAKDGESYPLYTNIPVLINIVDLNDEAPYFAPSTYYPVLAENLPSGSSVVQVTAKDPDSGGSLLRYTITKGNEQNNFVIDPQSGLITTLRPLDREFKSEYKLTVSASDGGTPPVSTDVTFTVKITDENDNQPEFKEKQYVVGVFARQATSKSFGLYQVVATDEDIGSNADLRYSITKGNRDNKFIIDSRSGEIFTNVSLVDGESYDLTIVAEDNGLPKLSTSTNVLIDVIQGNKPSKNAPVFWNKQYSADIQEDKRINSFVLIIGAEDPDFDQITYNIASGNHGNKFTIDRYGGFITVAHSLDREEKSFYSLRVEATDGYNTASVPVTINILDVNDNSPQPARREYRAHVAENSDVGTLVTTVKDPDAGVNGEVEYCIVQTAKAESASLFKIESHSGRILTVKPLDYETMQEHVLTIKASDRGIPKRETLFSVVVSVDDVNDHKPEFLSPLFESEVDVSAKAGTAILRVIATDKDDGTNSKLKYSIVSGNTNKSLSVDQNSGVVKVAGRLSTLVHQYALKVQSTDGGEPPLKTQVDVKVKVRGIVKNFAFEKPKYEVSLPENSPPDQAIATVVYNGILPVYEIVPGRSPCWRDFTVQRQSGVIISKKSFDAEEVTHCKLEIRANSTDGQHSSTLVIVTIQDKNDNQPIFEHARITGHVTEGSPQGTAVLDHKGSQLVAVATDQDISGDKLTYEIVETSARDVFSIHPATGAITTAKVLDYEVTPQYAFKIKVTDSGNPRLSAFADVKIHVTDINDIAPVFSASTYHATVYLPSYAGTRVTMVTATDGDSAANLTFSLARQDTELFAVNPLTGVVTVSNAALLRRDTYTIKLTVSDGNHTAHARVRIRCENLPSSDLQFSRKNYSASVREGVSVDSELVTVRALGYPIGSTITYTIINPSELFHIVPSTGVMSIRAGFDLDRESIDAYQVIVQARDDSVPPNVAQAAVHVQVIDRNDNQPVFINSPYFIVLQLGVAQGTIIGQAQATDADIGSNANLRYDLIGGDPGYFSISRKTGEVVVRRTLDDVKVPRLFTLMVEATDGLFRTEAVVKIKVVDKETPVFDQLSFSKVLAEDTPIGSEVTSVTARSPNGAGILYSITGGDPVNQFSIDFKTGVVTLVSSLDYETRTKYKLVVRATDARTSSHSDVAVDVTVTDVNDVAPAFNRSLYLATISESTPVDTAVVTVKAIDGDSGINKEINYFIQNVSRVGAFFKIDKKSGVVFVAKSLDYESRVVHEMIIVAADEGKPSLTGETRVRVVLMDANDNAPRFDKSMYAASILGSASPGQFVTRILATDPDEGDAKKLRYSITGGQGRQHFQIDSQSGVITLSRVVGIKQGKVYGLDVEVSDSVHVSTSKVRVIIGDTNDHSPIFSEDVYKVSFNENYPEGTFVTMVSATDLDSGNYAHLTYSIDSVDAMRKFRIDADSGMLYSRLMFDRENSSQAIMSVPIRATDGGGRFGFCVVEVHLIDENDNQPIFELKNYDTTISRSVTMGTPVLMTSASDPDASSNAALTYVIVGHQTPPVFTINAATGVIQVSREPEVKSYNFFVLVKDGGNPLLRSIASVKITVLERDARILHFGKSKYDVTVGENAEMGQIVTGLNLVVPGGNPVDVDYRIIKGNNDNNDRKFGVDSTGRVRVIGRLDYEIRNRYVMIVEANVSAINQIARTVVVVQVLDINDVTPKFVSDPYLASIPENIDIGSKVLRVFAEDLDSGSNGMVTYALVSKDKLVKEKFDIDQHTGWITTRGALDREKQPSFEFQVRATDNGTTRLTSLTTVRAIVLDVNDTPPKFSQSEFMASVKEDALIGQSVTTITATDEDLNTELYYFILSGDPQARFGIERKTGVIFVHGSLDRESVGSYDLNISASDGLFTSFAQMKIDIEDANDNPPICTQSIYVEHIKENTPLGSTVLTVGATDADVGVNAELTYSVFGQGFGTFAVDKNGKMTNLVELDRETRPFYNFMVSAADIGGQACYSNISIHLDDVNDNRPLFSQSSYFTAVYEDAPLKKVLLQVKADDADVGVNRKLTYSLVTDAGGTFTIETGTGIISLEKPLNRELKENYTLNVEVMDGGTPPLSSIATVQIKVLNINDVPPEFSHSIYHGNVSEDAPIGNEVVRVRAVSRESSNDVITYAILRGADSGLFSIDRKNGTIHVNRKLDYETTKLYTLTVEASDAGPPVLRSTSYVRISVTDSNDNGPEFSEKRYSAKVDENSALGTFVLQVFATDRDSGTNAQIKYSIAEGNDAKKFKIVEETGVIKVSGDIDREEVASYRLKVRAQDQGLPPQVADTVVDIEVTDVNDNSPEFSSTNLTTVLSESSLPNAAVIHLRPHDRDALGNGAPYQFTLISGDASRFKLHSNGLITKIGDVSHSDGQYRLRVLVADNGHPPQSTEVSITVKIAESKTHPPNVHPLTVYVNLYGSNLNGGVIGRVKATDKDGDLLHYSLVSSEQSSLLMISDEGTVRARANISPGTYNLNVSVTDKRYTVYSGVTVIVLNITPETQEHSVTLRLGDLSAGTFVEKSLEKCLLFIGKLLDVPAVNIHVWSMQPSDNDLDVVIAVRKRRKGMFKPLYLTRQLNGSHLAFEKNVGVRIVTVGLSQCRAQDCPTYLVCSDVYKPELKQIRVMSDHVSYISYEHSRSHSCTCQDKNRGCGAIQKCATSPCAPGYKCKDFPEGYQCKCPLFHILGNNARTFNGDSYIRYRLKETFDQPSRSIGLALKTVKSEGTLVFAAGQYDYSILEISKGFIQLRFDFGSGPGVVSIDWSPVNDGKWHHVAVERQGNHATVTLDYGKHQASGKSPGRMRILNLDGNSIYFGAKVLNSRIKRSEGQGVIVENGFKGCMQNLNVNGKDLPMTGSNTYASGYPSNAELSTGTFWTRLQSDYVGACASSPCRNGGSCLAGQHDDFICDCPKGVSGKTCEVDSRPCASNPCFFNGNCTNKGSDFECKCPNDLSGKRCEHGFHCNRLPCMNGGSCETRDGAAVCLCPRGFTGLDCSVDVDECQSNPCLNDGACVNTRGSFRCNCSGSTHGGELCNTVLANISPDKDGWPLGRDEIIAIGTVLAILLLVVLIVVLILRRRAHRKRELDKGHAPNRQSLLKVSPPEIGSEVNSPTPPTPPPR
ncbi:predicted protein, partial [Nematostella vectensis]